MNLLENHISDPEVIQKLIPQKPPFMMVDELIYYSQDKIISGLRIKEDNLFVQNKFMAASGIIENMAQTVALHTGYHYFLRNESAPVGYIGAIKKVEVDSLPKIGQQLSTTVTILHDIMGVTLVNAIVTCDGIEIARSEMKTVLAK
jgi:predicted hotdog family 3-hydroxylacyl-ACP dehydratase